MSFKDPENIKEIIDNFPLETKSNTQELLSYVKHNLKGWIVDTSKQFSIDIGKYNYQWAEACGKLLHCDPQRVLLVVDTFIKEDNYTLVRECCSRLSQVGFVVVPITQFTKCSMCNEVIVSKEIIEKNGYRFSGKCQGCFKYDPRK